ncbi:cytochrome P450 [Lactarius sanguifluus]|nr:cytochrome P450 [Lactarius sanguifluus]KAH9165239.1 cytochrome P450 [Lactarius sanguifluus]
MATTSFSPSSSSVLGGGYGEPVRLAAATTLVSLSLWLLTRLIKNASRKLPPGPKGLPLIGDIRHATDHGWLSSPERKNDYGEMMYVSVLGQGLLVLNSRRVAVDLLEKRSNMYSDRPHNIVLCDYMSEGLSLASTPNNDLLRRFRRATMDSFSKSGVSIFQPVQHREAMMLALDLMKNPPDRETHLRRHSMSIMLSINYHLPPAQSESDPLLVGITDRIRHISHTLEPGAHLVEFFPWLRYAPSMFAKWKREAQLWFVETTSLFERLVSNVADDLANGIDKPSFAAALIKNQEKYNLSERERAWIAGTMLFAGGETASSILEWWLLAMVAHPEIQTRAHSELDKVVGRARPPTFADLPSLPYIRAIVKETLRWAQVAPFGIPHRSTADDWYEGVFIPKGTVCMPNIRMINSDTGVFGADAIRFNPDRYLDAATEEREMGSTIFGFGRRVCLGRFIAEGTLAIDAATLLWAMRFERPKGVQGELDTETCVLEGFSARPVRFEVRASPRFPETKTLIVDALELYK